MTEDTPRRAWPDVRRAAAGVGRLANAPLARGLLAFLALAAAAAVLVRALQPAELAAIGAAIAATPGRAIAAALAFTAASYACLAIQEWVALRYIGRPTPLRRMLAPSLGSNAIAACLGVGLASGTALRLKLYPPRSLSARRTAVLVVVFSAATLLSAVITGGLALLAAPQGDLASLRAPWWVKTMGELALLSPVALWFAPLRRILGMREAPVSTRLRAGALAAGIGDWIFSCAAFFALTGQDLSAFPGFLAVFVLGSVMGALAGLPGGLGVFDAVIIGLAPPSIRPHEAAAALLLFRSVYFLAPLTLTLAAIAARQGLKLLPRRAEGAAGPEQP